MEDVKIILSEKVLTGEGESMHPYLFRFELISAEQILSTVAHEMCHGESGNSCIFYDADRQWRAG